MSLVLTRDASLRQAFGCDEGVSRENILQHVFAFAFRQMVYAQIWEDPEIDIEALDIKRDDHIVTIASGGCNALSYLVADPKRVTALDLNHAHIALGRLKTAGLSRLPDWETFFAFFGKANQRANLSHYRTYLADALDSDSRTYWERRAFAGFGRAPITLFTRNIFRHGLLGRFIGLGHILARCYGIRLRDALELKTASEQRAYFDIVLSPLFDKRLVRWAASNKMSLYGLGIPPAQYEALAGGKHMADVLRERLRKLACDFKPDENYFAWQAFARSYSAAPDASLPPYLQRRNFASLRARADRIEFLQKSFTDHLASLPDKSRDCYVLLDAQDWMSDSQLNALWEQITRTARPGARVIFRTAAEETLLPGRVADGLLSRWTYQARRSADLTLRDRSAIYGAFHLYTLRA